MTLGRTLFLATGFLIVSVSSASSLAAMIGDAFVKLPPPTGFCELTPRYEFDGRTMAMLSAFMAGQSVKLLAMSADCDQLAAARESKRRRIEDVVLYQISESDMKMPTPFSVASQCKILRIVRRSPIGTDVDARQKAILEAINSNEVAFIGVVGEDDNACYTGTLIRQNTDEGAVKVFVELQASTVVQTRAIMVRRQGAYQDRDTIKVMLTKLKSDVAGFVAANP